MVPTSLAKRRVTRSFSAKRAEFQFILVVRSTSARDYGPDAGMPTFGSMWVSPWQR